MVDKMTVKQALKAIQTEVNYHAGSDTHYRAEKLEQSLATLRAEIKRLRAEVERLRGLVVSRFDQDGPPTFRQGTPENELEDPVTAEHCAWFVAEIKRLREEVERLRADRDSWEQQASDRVADWYAEHLRAERLAEALALLPDEHDMIEHNPDEGPRMFCCWQKVKLRGLHDYLINHDKGCWYAQMRALREQEDHND